jgi:hypothetical protein
LRGSVARIVGGGLPHQGFDLIILGSRGCFRRTGNTAGQYYPTRRSQRRQPCGSEEPH